MRHIGRTANLPSLARRIEALEIVRLPAQFGLAGQLIEQVVEEVDLAKLLEKTVRNFDPTAPTIDKRDMEREWKSGCGTVYPPLKPPPACTAGKGP